MAFEPFGFGDRWYDRLGMGLVTPIQFGVLLFAVIILIVAWQFG